MRGSSHALDASLMEARGSVADPVAEHVAGCVVGYAAGVGSGEANCKSAIRS